MSTFDGLIEEFPRIRIDYFRNHFDRPAPRACFLSHVHSDHLQGLETLKMPFVYCSAATKSILLQMEKYPHRMNFAKGILEARKQTYKHLKPVLVALPLETPVEIDNGPNSKIRVTLFDANHCPGSVMFLIEGKGLAVLYTGDVRAEPWWLNSIVRNPVLLPYASGLKRMTTIYLDTTFASHNDIHEEFPTKAEGLKELLAKVSRCRKDTVYYFRSWTLGYENVWIALSNFLRSPIHVDDYQLRLFKSLVEDPNPVTPGISLAGFAFGNHSQAGCLTDDDKASIHSCEPGTECYDNFTKQKNVVWISPIISRLGDGTEVSEMGAGGGGGDLYQNRQLEVINEISLNPLEAFCTGNARYKTALTQLRMALSEAVNSGKSSISLEGLSLHIDDDITLETFIRLLSSESEPFNSRSQQDDSSNRTIHFPYSRHSSYSELRQLVSTFKPKDVCPCVVDFENWTEDISMRSLFADVCSDNIFKYDEKSRTTARERQRMRRLDMARHGLEYGDSQRTGSQASRDSSEIYRSAKTSLRREDGDSSRAPPQQRHESVPENSDQCSVPQHIKALNQELAGLFDDSYHESTTIFDSNQDTTVSFLPLSSFHPLDSDATTNNTTKKSAVTRKIKKRLQSRVQAYHAAQRALNQHDHSAWEGLQIRSVGWKGHTEEEMIL